MLPTMAIMSIRRPSYMRQPRGEGLTRGGDFGRSRVPDAARHEMTRRRAGTHASVHAAPGPRLSSASLTRRAASGARDRSARRDRLGAAVVVEPTLRLAAEPAGFDVFHQQRARAVL